MCNAKKSQAAVQTDDVSWLDSRLIACPRLLSIHSPPPNTTANNPN